MQAVFKILGNIPVFMHSLKIWDKMGERMTPLSFRMLIGIYRYHCFYDYSDF